MSNNALRKNKLNSDRIRRKKLSLHTNPNYESEVSYNKLKRQDKKIKASVIAFIFFSIAFMSILTIYNYIKLTKARNEYNNLQSQYTSYQLTKDRLESNLEDSIDINEIQRYAIEDLGMVYENKDNIVYLDIDR